MRSTSVRQGLALLAALTLTLLVSCTGSSESASDSSDSSSATGESGPASSSSAAAGNQELIAKAQHQAAQYDYDGAIATLAADSSKAAKEEVAKIEAAKAQAVVWPDNSTIPHIFYHSLVVDPARAFSAGSEGVGFSQYMATVSEFNAQIQQMYDNGWVLVHPQRIASIGADGKMAFNPITLPPGKKPFVLSLDDLSYYEYMEGKGFADNLFVAPDGRVLNNYTDKAGVTTQGSYDVVPLLDDFVREHPDFSYHGDKGTIAMTGYNGLFGYRSSIQSYGDTPATHEAMANAKVVADAIKANGWMFASHGWGHINFGKKDMSWLTTDSKYWDAEVRPIVGDTPLLIFAFGADIAGKEPYNPNGTKYVHLHQQEGFDYFFGVNPVPWMQLGPDYLRQTRINIDGLMMQAALSGYTDQLDQFFDTKSTVDPLRPLPVPDVNQGGPKPGGN